MNERISSIQFYTRVGGVMAATILTSLSDYHSDMTGLYILAFLFLIYTYMQYRRIGVFNNPFLQDYGLMVDVAVLTIAIGFRGGLRSDYYLGYFLILSYGMFVRENKLLWRLVMWVVISYTGVTYFATTGMEFSFGRLFIRLSLIVGTMYILRLNSQFLFDIDEQRQKAMYLSLVDKLTGAYNRRIFDTLEGVLDDGKLYEMALIDLDDFKQINDKYGHSKGDEVLKALAITVSNNITDADWFIRYGGEEFLIVLQNNNRRTTHQVISKIQDGFSKAEFDWIKEGNVTFTAGIGRIDKEVNIYDAIQVADENLYKGKLQGKNCIVS